MDRGVVGRAPYSIEGLRRAVVHALDGRGHTQDPRTLTCRRDETPIPIVENEIDQLDNATLVAIIHVLRSELYYARRQRAGIRRAENELRLWANRCLIWMGAPYGVTQGEGSRDRYDEIDQLDDGNFEGGTEELVRLAREGTGRHARWVLWVNQYIMEAASEITSQ